MTTNNDFHAVTFIHKLSHILTMPAALPEKPRRAPAKAGGILLVLFRHGPAADRNPLRYPDDDLRPLTPAGRKRVKAAGRGLRALGFVPERLHCSPALRARETAEILAETFRLPARTVRMEPALHGDADPAVLVRKVLRTEPAGRVLWVGHEPWLGEAVGLLTGGPPVPLRKAGVAFLEISPGGRRAVALRGLLPHEWLAALA
jgi:phosphohistidine phosphatase